tara:strand:- start:1021 stop:1347 length:327 start_codon:yes stop_codon:yes gene_type:complete
MTKAKTKTETLTILSYFMDDLNSIQKVFSSTNEEIKSIDFTRDVEDRHLDLTATNFQDSSEERTEITTTAVEDGWRINRDYHLTSTITRNLVLEDLELVALRKYKEEA